MKVVRDILKILVRVASSKETMDLLDTNKDGKLSFKEVWKAPKEVRLEILGDIGMKIAPYLLLLLL